MKYELKYELHKRLGCFPSVTQLPHTSYFATTAMFPSKPETAAGLYNFFFRQSCWFATVVLSLAHKCHTVRHGCPGGTEFPNGVVLAAIKSNYKYLIPTSSGKVIVLLLPLAEQVQSAYCYCSYISYYSYLASAVQYVTRSDIEPQNPKVTQQVNIPQLIVIHLV